MLLAKVKGLTIWYRPEPKEGTVGRLATSGERVVEQVLRKYVANLQETEQNGLKVSILCGVRIMGQEPRLLLEILTQSQHYS